jgi:hypothetical protein
VIIDHPGVACYFLEVFEDDWNPTVKSPGIKTDYLKIAAVAIVLVLLVLFYYHHHKE